MPPDDAYSNVRPSGIRLDAHVDTLHSLCALVDRFENFEIFSIFFLPHMYNVWKGQGGAAFFEFENLTKI